MAATRCGRFSGFLDEYPEGVAIRHVWRDSKVMDEVTSVSIKEGITNCAPGMPSAIVVAPPKSAPPAPSNNELPHRKESATASSWLSGIYRKDSKLSST